MKYEFIDEKALRREAFVNRALGDAPKELTENDIVKLSSSAAASAIRNALLRIEGVSGSDEITVEAVKIQVWAPHVNAEYFGAFIARNIKALEGVHLEHALAGNSIAMETTERDIEACKNIEIPKPK